MFLGDEFRGGRKQRRRKFWWQWWGGGSGSTVADPWVADHNGTWDSPQALTLGTPFTAKVGSSAETVTNTITQFPGYLSYYQFTNGSASTVVAITVGNSSPLHLNTGTTDYYMTTLYGPGGINGASIATALVTDNIFPLFLVAGSSQYGLVVQNYLIQNTTYQLTVTDELSATLSGALSASLNDGPSGTPPLLPIGTGYAATTSYVTGAPTEASYYKFTTPVSATTATITYPTSFLNAYLYSDPGFGTQIDSENSIATKNLSVSNLAGSTTYYLKMIDFTSHTSMIKYTLTVTSP